MPEHAQDMPHRPLQRSAHGAVAPPPVYRPVTPVQAKLGPPPVYRPGVATQAKMAAPLAYRPGAGVQAKLSPPSVYRPAATAQAKVMPPPVYRPGMGVQKKSTAPHGVIQRTWVHSGNGDWYWDDNFGMKPWRPEFGGPPHNGNVVPSPFSTLPDTHKARGGGSMESLRTRPDYPEQRFDALCHFAGQAREQRGVFYEGPTEVRGLGLTPVTGSIPPRSSVYTTNFAHESGYRSSTQYQSHLGIGPEIVGGYQILHLAGHGQVGSISNTGGNLVSGGHGTNDVMIPIDDLVTGDTDVEVGTHALCRPDTLRAEVVRIAYYLRGESYPFFTYDIDGDLPQLTRSQYQQIKEWAKRALAEHRKFAKLYTLANAAEDMDYEGPHHRPPPGSGGGGLGSIYV